MNTDNVCFFSGVISPMSEINQDGLTWELNSAPLPDSAVKRQTDLCDWRVIQTMLWQIQRETGSCHFIYTKYMWNSKVNIFFKGKGCYFSPPEMSWSQPSHLQSWNTSDGILVLTMKHHARNQRVNACYRRRKFLSKTCVLKLLTFQDMNCWNSLKFLIPQKVYRGMLECLLCLWFADTMMKGKYFWLNWLACNCAYSLFKGAVCLAWSLKYWDKNKLALKHSIILTEKADCIFQ